MVEKLGDNCKRHNLEIEKYIQRNENGTIESVFACKSCALILEGAGYKIEKDPAVAGQEEEKGAFGLPKKVLDNAKKAQKRAFGDEIPWWLED